MAHLYVLLTPVVVPLIVGVVVGILIHRAPRRGWIGLALLFVSALFWILNVPNDSAAPDRLWAMPCFTFLAPVAVIYSFRSRKGSPDRLLANAAFFGSFLIAAALLFVLCGVAYVVYLIIAMKAGK